MLYFYSSKSVVFFSTHLLLEKKVLFKAKTNFHYFFNFRMTSFCQNLLSRVSRENDNQLIPVFF